MRKLWMSGYFYGFTGADIALGIGGIPGAVLLKFTDLSHPERTTLTMHCIAQAQKKKVALQLSLRRARFR